LRSCSLPRHWIDSGRRITVSWPALAAWADAKAALRRAGADYIVLLHGEDLVVFSDIPLPRAKVVQVEMRPDHAAGLFFALIGLMAPERHCDCSPRWKAVFVGHKQESSGG